MKLSTHTLLSGRVMEIHRCDICGKIHIEEQTNFGTIIPCPAMPEDEVRWGTERMIIEPREGQ